jgi:hypothetical protein
MPGHRQARGDRHAETERLADLIEGVAGEFSPFEELRGFSIDGVDLSTSALPARWRSRLVKVQNANTAAPDGEPQYAGWCLDKEDLCVAKLCAFREKDQNFVAALPRARRLRQPQRTAPPQELRHREHRLTVA